MITPILRLILVILLVLVSIIIYYIITRRNTDKSKPHFVSQQEHRTEKYNFINSDNIVVRRGFDFVLKGDIENSNIIITPPSNIIRIKEKNRNSIIFTTDVTAPLNKSIISIYNKNNKNTTDITVYIIFNPYNKDDTVYMDKKDKNNVDLLDEYILNEHGIVFVGEYPEAWYYGHFEQNTFVTIMDMILSAGPGDGDTNTIPDPPVLNDPVSVSRYLSWAVGNNIIAGAWPTGQQFYDHTYEYDTDTYPDTPIWRDKVSCKTNDECSDPKINKNSYNNLCTPEWGSTCTINGLNGYNDWKTTRSCDDDNKCNSDRRDFEDVKKAGWDMKYLDNKVVCKAGLSINKTCGFTQAPNDWNNNTQTIYDQVVANSKVYDNILHYGYPDKSNYMSASYGQCWVIASALLSACRTIGIPCRQVTNVGSAHDESYCKSNKKECLWWQGNFKAIMVEEEGNPGNYVNGMVWNFHAWNDIWIKRPDLGSDYDGWQALDSTIQENSMGISRMGPAPLVALQRGEINTLFDVPFLNSEVNWKIKKYGEDKLKDTGGGTVYTGTPNLPMEYYNSKNISKDKKILKEITTLLNNVYKPQHVIDALNLASSPIPKKQDDIKLTFTDKIMNIKISSVLNGTASINVSVYMVTYTNNKLSNEPVFNYTQSLVVSKNNISTMNVNLDKIVPGKTNYFQCIVSVLYPNKDTHISHKTLYVKPVTVDIKVEKCCEIKDKESKNLSFSFTNTTGIKMSNVVLEAKNKYLNLDLHTLFGTILPGKTETINTNIYLNLKGINKTETVIIAKLKYSESYDQGKGSVGLQIK
jgi:hypothetical protein